ncbi:MAG: hypothetical protein SFU98_21090 [Leptospiraceae bacterium]|nr:hypothetical protein [Leptospiraceae bacterium]
MEVLILTFLLSFLLYILFYIPYTFLLILLFSWKVEFNSIENMSRVFLILGVLLTLMIYFDDRKKNIANHKSIPEKIKFLLIIVSAFLISFFLFILKPFSSLNYLT